MRSSTDRLWRLLPIAGLVLLLAATVAGIAAVWLQPRREVARVTRVTAQREARPDLPALRPDRDTVRSGGPAATAAAAPVRTGTPTCERCHGELELLRQHVTQLDSARALLVYAREVQASAHGALDCAECHTGYREFPHRASAATATCGSCHEAEDSAWHGSAHAEHGSPYQQNAVSEEGGVQAGSVPAEPDGNEVGAGATDAARCASCHTVHSVESVATLETDAGVATMNARCVACHAEEPMPASDPHASRVACAACHGAHGTQPIDEAGSLLATGRQAETCGACHTEALEHWRDDVHGDTTRALAAAVTGTAGTDPRAPECTACHGAHGMLAPTDSAFAFGMVQACGSCHEHALRTFYDSYHGQAAELGSSVAATCSDCHGTHDIYGEDDVRSHVASDNLLETCGQCHAHARAGFVAYDSHPDPFNPERNLWLSLAFWFMNGLLVFVLTVFGAHTVLWWVKILRDRRRGVSHGAHGGGMEET